jgi:hypothetical protein
VKGFDFLLNEMPADVEEFANILFRLAQACGQVDIRFVFLLDEAKRVLGSRFPRGFQDNLFSLLFGETGGSIKIAMVFSGNQHLNELLKDDTSPIGSRSLSVNIVNLNESSLVGLVQMIKENYTLQVDAHQIARDLIKYTGGHAGLTAQFLNRMLTDVAKFDPKIWMTEVGFDSEVLFENWILSMSHEGRDCLPYMTGGSSISIQKISGRLAKRGLNRFLARRVVEEYEYSGIGYRDDSNLYLVNELFWDYVKDMGDEDSPSVPREEVWLSIEEAELNLRQLVLSKFQAKFSETAYEKMKKILGDAAWVKIVETLEKSKEQYRYSRGKSHRDIMSCMYLGQLGMLMTNGISWDMFKGMFRDKRELEDKLACIMPVRNDCAHFCDVPEKELDRCRIACDDLLAVAEREVN